MNIQISKLQDIEATGDIQLVANGGDLGLYVAGFGRPDMASDPASGFAATLSLHAPAAPTTSLPQSLAIPTLLTVPPLWNLVASGSAPLQVAASQFGGGWNILSVSEFKDSKLAPLYSYKVEDTRRPHFMLNSSSKAASQQFVSAIFSGYQFGLIGLQTQDGQQVPHVSGIVGTSAAPVSAGRIIGDLSSGLPATVSLVYQGAGSGETAPSGGPAGPLSLANYDINNNKLGTPVPLLGGFDIGAFDLAVAGGNLCLFAVTSAGVPIIATYDMTGKLIDGPVTPVGSWLNGGHWAASPTIVPTPGSSGSFSLAFVEMQAQDRVAIQFGTTT
ncbi:MAG: hypothetical protein EP335_17050 [Alphaproteobacteria bacterium]|nr:MAG: hypothetical protein EP335_17050 [Alphaproteobacteria bacterium]